MTLFGKLEAQDDAMFQLFWSAYDYKVDKGAARRAWRNAVKREYPSNIVQAAESYARTRGPDKKFWPYPARWLNGERWLEQQPKEQVQKIKTDAKLDSIAWHVKRGIRSTSYGPQDVELAYRAGKVTAEECEKYGVRV